MGSFFTFLGVLTAIYFAFKVWRALSYWTKVRYYILAAGGHRYGDAITVPFGRAMAHVMGQWPALLSRLRARGLEPQAAAVVAAAWLRDNAPNIPSRDMLAHMMHGSAGLLRRNLQHRLELSLGYEESVKLAYRRIDLVMREEGVSVLDYG